MSPFGLRIPDGLLWAALVLAIPAMAAGAVDYLGGDGSARKRRESRTRPLNEIRMKTATSLILIALAVGIFPNDDAHESDPSVAEPEVRSSASFRRAPATPSLREKSSRTHALSSSTHTFRSARIAPPL